MLARRLLMPHSAESLALILGLTPFPLKEQLSRQQGEQGEQETSKLIQSLEGDKKFRLEEKKFRSREVTSLQNTDSSM